MINMKKILVTGVAGFIGSNLAEMLIKSGHSVIGVDNLSYGLINQIPAGVEFYNFDITKDRLDDLLTDVSAVFHLAGKNCISDCQMDPLETAMINIIGTIKVFESVKRSGNIKVIHAESSSVYEGSLMLPSAENDTFPKSFYAKSKMAIKLFADAYTEFEGLNIVGLRYFCVYGPRQDYRRTIPPVMSAFILKLLKNESPIIYGNGEKRRDFIHVDDVNSFHLECLTNPKIINGSYNVGSGINFSVNEVFELVSKIVGVNSNIKPVYLNDLSGEADFTLANINKALSTGWSPKINLEQGIISSYNFIKSHVNFT